MKYSQWLSLIALGISLYIIWQLRNILLLALTAVIFVVVLNRAIRFLQRWIPSRALAVAALALSTALIIGVFGVVFVPPLIRQLRELINLTPDVISRLQDWISQIEEIAPTFSIQNFQSIEDFLDQLRSLNLDMIFGRFFTFFSNTLTVSFHVLLVTVLMIMILLNPRPYRNLFIHGFPSSSRQRVSTVMDRCEESIAGWFIGIIFNMTIIGLMSMIGLWILGIPLAFANGLLAGLLAFIPNVGPTLSVVPPTAIALLGTPWKAIAVIALYIVIQQLESNVLTPMVMRKQVSLLPAITLLSQVIFAAVFGFLGLLLALPLVLIIQQWLEEFWVKGFLEQH
ncbi:MAG: AI-2E family transporter [Leptolyngbyaceae bacterium]|nr:AI-2E family transporter [Leptolyngbyaceae bacterium]